MKKRKYDINIDGYRIRNDADFNRVDMTKAERDKLHRTFKLGKRDWYKQVHKELMEDIEKCRNLM